MMSENIMSDNMLRQYLSSADQVSYIKMMIFSQGFFYLF